MLFKLILYGVIFYLIYQAVRKLSPPQEGRSGSREPNDRSRPGEDLVEDPCCHTYIPVSNARRDVIDGRTVYFCSQKCLDEYRSRKN